jgi:hypothetical protein
MEVRRALGATSGRSARQVLTEICVFALSGGVARVQFAYDTVPVLKAVLPIAMPRADQIGLSGTVLWSAAGSSMLTRLIFGAIPDLPEA